MKNLTGALAFSASLLLAVACHKNTGESPSASDAATTTTPATEALDAAEAVKDEVRDAAASRDAATAGATRPETDRASAGTSTDASTRVREAQEACVDRWLKQHDLDQYGHAAGTMYAGGTPLFNERTGESKDRLDYVYGRQPEARQACATAGK